MGRVILKPTASNLRPTDEWQHGHRGGRSRSMAEVIDEEVRAMGG
eukprot:CAMPEP_0119495172 /NCGR_PEP_ID=MMETSP1344-20130328/18896_1 /TAXON_ID=236787 /ORGANISM="Florenciella parvula, Strain CCMP2471" /LENGTH=44 /DNA_ID= /DNA_START= /DNA_END= /DNA_ORIENTATION=